jgi:histidine ammonia-lyase
MTHEHAVTVGTSGLTLAEVVAVSRGDETVVISENALTAMSVARAQIEALAASPEPVYGVSTGFGALATRHIPLELRPAAALARPLARGRQRAPRSSARSSARSCCCAWRP